MPELWGHWYDLHSRRQLQLQALLCQAFWERGQQHLHLPAELLHCLNLASRHFDQLRMLQVLPPCQQRFRDFFRLASLQRLQELVFRPHHRTCWQVPA